MYIARFSYHLRPSNRQRAIEFISREVKAAKDRGLKGRLLIINRHAKGTPIGV